MQHVRAYVKRREIVRQPVDLTRIAAAVRRDLSIKHPAVRLEAALPADPVVAAGDPLEIELLLNNLVKNAVEAVAGTPEPAVLIRLKAENGRAVIEVEDNAADTKPEDVRYFATTPLASSKKSGLGLGLLICKSIAEAHRAGFSLSARSSSALRGAFRRVGRIRASASRSRLRFLSRLKRRQRINHGKATHPNCRR